MKKIMVIGIKPELRRLFKKVNATSTGDKLYVVNYIIREVLCSNKDMILVNDVYITMDEYKSSVQYILTILHNKKYNPWKIYIPSIRNNRMVLEYEE